jgi:hypothetical protein
MTATEYLLWLTGMALVITAVVALRTLAAADLIHRPRPRSRGEDRPEAKDALAPLGSSLTAGAQLGRDSAPEADTKLHDQPREAA